MERSFLAYLRGRCRHLPQVKLGIGDDAAVIAPPDGADQVVCVDQIVDGVDFISASQSLGDIGFKSMAINLSDIAAMGGVPTSVLVSVALPDDHATRIAGDLYEGILEAAQRYGVAIAGGDLTTHVGPLLISVTMIGQVPRDGAWRRDGAGEGEIIFLTGPVGGSLLGRHLRPQPRIELAAWLRDRVNVTSAIDISDGLSLDLDRLCAASGVGAVLDVNSIPIHDDAVTRSHETGKTPFEHAWGDGEDFELIFTVGENDAGRIKNDPPPTPVFAIGHTSGRTGMWKQDAGKLIRMTPRGFVHRTGQSR